MSVLVVNEVILIPLKYADTKKGCLLTNVKLVGFYGLMMKN
jgi:hypothetical protein